MTRGRKAIPTAMKRLRGTSRKDRERQEPAPPPAHDLEPPEWLDDVAADEWRRVAPLLAELALLTDADRSMLAIYCGAYARLLEANRHIAAEGEVLTTPNGHRQRNPWATTRAEAERTIERAAAHFGLSPSARSRIDAPTASKTPKDPILKFLRPHRGPPGSVSEAG